MDVNQDLACSVIVPRNDTFVLRAVDCTDISWTACVIYRGNSYQENLEF